MSDNNIKEVLISSTAKIVAACVDKEVVSKDKLGKLIEDVFKSLSNCAQGKLGSGNVPAVSIEDSINDDYIVCLEDGKKLKMLKRYLKTHYNMTPEVYRKKWGLPLDYPFVAPNYAKTRSKLAKNTGLGK
ncbi:MAG: MucR family transcriptional regulator [Alphaproteobacteria bacterium]|jgi:predicted transcriptional regulator|nr:MucR family transcriptional regulator [Alphaproteobacteria bacterium]